jgi:hypothetical protein
MSTAFSDSKELAVLPSFVAETKLLQYFAKVDGAFLIESESNFENEKCFLAQVQSGGIAGFGRAPSKRTALVKAVAEYYERRLMHEVFADEFSHVPKVLQTSNGFAVHFSQDQANQAATNEAIERHLLQYSYLKDGWQGFELIHRKTIGDESLMFVQSRYEINNLRAGMVIATSKRFPGVSFGYFADQSNKIESSRRWSHAISEALDKIEPFLNLARSRKTANLMPIEQGILDWMMRPQEKMAFSEYRSARSLPDVAIEYKDFDLAERWNLDFPLFGSYCYSPGVLPLLVVDRIKQEGPEFILDILQKFDLPRQLPERNPVL